MPHATGLAVLNHTLVVVLAGLVAAAMIGGMVLGHYLIPWAFGPHPSELEGGMEGQE